MEALEKFGYTVLAFEEADAPRPDFLVACDTDVIAVECKSIGVSGAKPGRFGVRSDPHFKRSGIESAIRKAEKQLASPVVPHGAIRLIWISSVGLLDSVFELQRAEGELLGLRTCVVPDPSGEKVMSMKGLFARTGRFERNHGLDCAVLVSNEGARLYTNPFSERRDHVLRSRIFLDFADHKAAVDLAKVGPADGFLVCEARWDRDDDTALANELALKYEYERHHVRIIDFTRHHLSVSVPRHTGRTGARPTE